LLYYLLVLYRLLANAVVAFHALFILFVVLGALLAWRWRWVAAIHVPCALWGILIEYRRWICPLTPLESSLRARAGQAGYSGGFIEHYLMPAIYPSGLTPRIRAVLGTAVLVINVFAYGILIRRLTRGPDDHSSPLSRFAVRRHGNSSRVQE
jgi:hypothetical protein